MASGQTQYYELNQWEGRDQVLRTEFNADNARIDRGPPRAESAQLPALHAHLYGDGERRPQLHFPHRPAAVLIMGGIVTFLCAIQGESYIYLRYGNVDTKSRAVWEGSTVSWELANDDPVLAANAAGGALHPAGPAGRGCLSRNKSTPGLRPGGCSMIPVVV